MEYLKSLPRGLVSVKCNHSLKWWAFRFCNPLRHQYLILTWSVNNSANLCMSNWYFVKISKVILRFYLPGDEREGIFTVIYLYSFYLGKRLIYQLTITVVPLPPCYSVGHEWSPVLFILRKTPYFSTTIQPTVNFQCLAIHLFFF